MLVGAPKERNLSADGTRCSSRRPLAQARALPMRLTSRPAPKSWEPPRRCSSAPNSSSKIKEPLQAERKRLKRGQVLFAYLHLAADLSRPKS